MSKVQIKEDNATITIKNSENFVELSIEDFNTKSYTEVWLSKEKAEEFITKLIKHRNELKYGSRSTES